MPLESNLKNYFKGANVMDHLKLGLFTLSVLVIAINSQVVTVDLAILHRNRWNILRWIAGLLLSGIVSSWFS